MTKLIFAYDLKVARDYIASGDTTPAIVVVNIWSGPGLKYDVDWSVVISTLQSMPHVTVYGYIDAYVWAGDGPLGRTVTRASQRDTTKAELESMLLRWISVYKVTSFFIDDVPRISNAVKLFTNERNTQAVNWMFNPGQNLTPSLVGRLHPDVIAKSKFIVFEDNDHEFMSWKPSGTTLAYKSNSFVVVKGHDQSNRDRIRKRLATLGFAGHVITTFGDDAKAYNRLGLY